MTSGSKGGVVGTLVDPSATLAALRRIRANNWRLSQVPPDGLEFDLFKRCADLYKRTASAIEAAAPAEVGVRLAWLDEMEAAFGVGTKRATIISELRAIRTAFSNAGMAGASAKRLDEALDALQSTQFDDSITAAKSLRRDGEALAMLPTFARARSAAVNNGRAVVDAATTFLDAVQSRLNEEAARQAVKVQTVQGDIAAIEAALMKIGENLDGAEVADVA